MKNRPKRGLVIAGITAGSAAAGAVASVLILAAVIAILEGSGYADVQVHLLGRAVLVMAGIGAVAGAVLGPAAGFLFLRHVPLGRVLLWTVTSTVLGAGGGVYAGLRDESVLPVTLGALGGFVISVFALSRTRAGPPAAVSREDAG